MVDPGTGAHARCTGGAAPAPAREVLRVGSVAYLVGRPLDHGLELEPGFRVERHVPARLVEGLRSGALDVALVSSIELFRAPGYRFLDVGAVAGDAHVASVQVFLRRPVEEVRSIALDPSSRAAATLVRVLVERELDGVRTGRPRPGVRFVEVPAGASARDAEADAWLAIGDPALREHVEHPGIPVFNPSRTWAERTGLPFVFATWIVRAGVELTATELEAFARARRAGTARREELARAAAAEWRLPYEPCRRYLVEECRYDPGDRLRPALRRFRDEAAALGLCEARFDPEPIEVRPRA